MLWPEAGSLTGAGSSAGVLSAGLVPAGVALPAAGGPAAGFVPGGVSLASSPAVLCPASD
jgi:hypothetical protein